MSEVNNLNLFYYRITDLWQKLCEQHHVLFDLTCQEYSILLKSDIDKLAQVMEEKESKVEEIKNLETLRADVVNEINSFLDDDSKINNVTDLINLMAYYEKQNNNNHLQKFNTLLIDIIEKIQEQNKKNQLFLNKAILELQKLREDVGGKKPYNNYNSQGVMKTP